MYHEILLLRYKKNTSLVLLLQALSRYPEEHYKSKPLDQIYTMVTNTVADKCHSIGDNDYKHIPQSMSTLRASLFLTSEPEVRVGIIALCHSLPPASAVEVIESVPSFSVCVCLSVCLSVCEHSHGQTVSIHHGNRTYGQIMNVCYVCVCVCVHHGKRTIVQKHCA